MTIQIRPALPEDAAPACAVLRRSILECCVEDHHNDPQVLAVWLGNKTPATVESWFLCAANFCLVALVNEAIEGVAILTRQGKIVLFYLTPEIRFTGAGKRLLQALEQQARSWKLNTLQVPSTRTAKSFYLRNGFMLERSAIAAYGAETLLLSKRLMPGSYPRRASCGCGT